MTSPSTARRWLGILARHYPSLLVSGVCHNAVSEIDALTAERDRMREALRMISLGSQNSMHSKEALGREARTALEETRE